VPITARSMLILCVIASLLAWPASEISAQQPPAPQPPAPQPPAQQQEIVREIDIRGNQHVPTADIAAQITQTKIGAPLRQEDVQADIRAIIDMGLFADATARLESIPGGGVRVIFLVIENPVVTEIIIEGNTVIPTADILKALDIPIGQVLNIRRMRGGVAAVEKLYEDKGFVLARIADTSIIPVDGGRLRVRIAEGQIEAIRFRGLNRTRPRIVERQLTIKPGQVFNINELNANLQRLSQLQLFENIRAQPEPGTDPDTVVLIIEVEEARTSSISGGVGYSTLQGLLGFVEYQDANWRGLGQTVTLRVQRSLLERGAPVRFNYDINFREPYLDSQQTSLDLALYSRASVETEFKARGTVRSRYQLSRIGSSIALARPLGTNTLVSLRLRSEETAFDVLPKDPTKPGSPKVPPKRLTPGRVISITAGGGRSTLNDPRVPTSGERQLVSLEVGLPFLGGQFGFTKTNLDYMRLFPTRNNAYFLARASAGFGTGNIPVQEQFALGGSSSLRALPFGALRANSVFVANLEYHFPLGTFIKELGEIQGIVFADVGNAPIRFTDVRIGYGVGVMVKTPIGPVRLDVAFGQGTTQTWISIGSPF
jgi:outer membrane protein insertion porin family